MNIAKSSVIGWVALGGLGVIGCALGARSAGPEQQAAGATNSNTSSNPDGTARGLVVDQSANVGAWTDPLAESRGSGIDTDGNFLIDFPNSTTRNVLRLRIRRFDPSLKSEYYVRVTANRAGALGAMSYKRLGRPPVAQPSADQENAVSLDGEDGEMVVSGTAPIIAVKKGTVASDGTTYAIEASSKGWSLSIIDVKLGHPVRVWFPDVNSTVREFDQPKCWFFKQGDYDPANATEIVGAECASLKTYADTILKRTP